MSARILVVDDMPYIREPIAAALRLAGYETLDAPNGREALSLIGTARPALVLLDLEMPILDGLGVLRRLQDVPEKDRPKILVLTASQDRRSVMEAKQFGVRHFLLKSTFSLENLLERVRSALGEAGGEPGPVGATTATASAPGNTPPASASRPEAGAVAGAPTGAAGDSDPAVTARSLKPIMTRSEVLDAIKGSEELKGFSPTVSRVMSMTSNQSCSVEAIAKAIGQDQAMALKILKIANSSVYSRGDRVDTVHKAVLRIGTASIRQAVMNIAVVERFQSLAFQEHLNTPQFWEHSIGCGLIAAELAHALAPKEADAAFTTGLLHDLGRAIYAESLGERYVGVIETARRTGIPLELAESRMLLLSHADIMDWLLNAWKFPRHLVEPIMLHHLSAANARSISPTRAAEILRLGLANRLAHALLLGSSGNETIYPTEEHCRALRLQPSLVQEIEAAIPQQTDDAKFALLSSTSAAAWPRRSDQVRRELKGPFRPLYVSAAPNIDAYRIFCGVIADGGDEPPNVIVSHVTSARERERLGAEVLAFEERSGAANLPLIVLSAAGGLSLPERVTAGRLCRVLATPTPVSAIVAAINEFTQHGESAQAA